MNLVFATPPGGSGGGGTPPSAPPVNFWDGPTGVTADEVITGGDGVWQVGGAPVWSQADGAVNGAFKSGIFAIFSATPCVVTVDNSSGAVTVRGMQFASGGYQLTGGAIGLGSGEVIVRVGDGSAQGEAFRATIASELTGPALRSVFARRATFSCPPHRSILLCSDLE